MRSFPWFVTSLALALAAPTHAGLALSLSGKPQLGKTLRIELKSTLAVPTLLFVDSIPGPVIASGVTFGVGFSPTMLILPLGTPGLAALELEAQIPNLPSLDGAALHLQAVAITPLTVSNTVPLKLASSLPLAAVDDFTYQLQGNNGNDLSLTALQNSAFDLCVIDFSRDGTTEFTPAQIAALKSAAEPNRIRLGYMSIGEAEDYRWYWDHISPALIVGSNPNWPGNFKVEFWQPEWKEVILYGNAAVGKSYLDRIIDQGFDGVYLDIVDAFEFFGPTAAGGQNLKRDAARLMAEFLVEIAYHARVTRGKPNFLVVPQNGANIIDPAWYPANTIQPGDPPTPELLAAKVAKRLLTTVDAIGVEDVFFYGNQNENNAYNPQNYLLNKLAAWQAEQVRVLSVEYVTTTGKVNNLYGTYAPAKGFIPYATVRDLDKLTINVGHEPD